MSPAARTPSAVVYETEPSGPEPVSTGSLQGPHPVRVHASTAASPRSERAGSSTPLPQEHRGVVAERQRRLFDDLALGEVVGVEAERTAPLAAAGEHERTIPGDGTKPRIAAELAE